MTIWIDAQISPSLALWINQKFDGIRAQSVRSLGLIDAPDKEIFQKARSQNIILMSKDIDFVKMLQKSGAPPKIIWLTCGNTSNLRLREIFSEHMLTIIDMLNSGNDLVEVK